MEQIKIETTNVVNEDNPWYGTDGGKNTSDKVFLLSYNETSKYFTNDTSRESNATEYAKSNGLYNEDNNEYQGNYYWWLRSPGNYQYEAGLVDIDGSDNYFSNVEKIGAGVRPALWINL